MRQLTSVLAIGALLALFSGHVAADEDKSAPPAKFAAGEKKEAAERKAKHDKNRLPKDRKPRAKDQCVAAMKKETAALDKIEVTIKVQVEVVEKRSEGEAEDELAKAIVEHFQALGQAVDAVEQLIASGDFDEDDIEAAIDLLTSASKETEEAADALEEIAWETDDADLYACVDALDDAVFELELVIEHLDDIADELDGQIGDDVDVIIVIEIG